MLVQMDFDLVHDILPGKHFYQFYKGSNDFLSVMVPYFQAGLEKGEACLWLVSKRNGSDLIRATAGALIQRFKDCLSSGQFQILSAEDWYLTDGSFDELKAIRNAEQYLEKIQKLGFETIRAAGDIGGATSRSEWVQIEDYEKKMSPWIKSQSVIALCAYPILECMPSQIKGILGCHEDVLVGQI